MLSGSLYRPLLVALFVCIVNTAPAVLAQTHTVVYDLENVWLDPDITRPWDPPQQMTGVFEWTYEEGDFENGTGQFIDLYTPWYNPGINDLNITVEISSIEFSLIGNYHDRGLDLTLRTLDPLSIDQPVAIDTVFSQFEIQYGVSWQGHVISGSIVPRTSATQVVPEGLKFLDGVPASGLISSLFEPDDQYLELDPNPTNNPIKQKIHMILQSTSITDLPTVFRFQLESKMLGWPTAGDVIQTIELYDYSTGLLELVDIRAASVADESVIVTPTGDLSRFVQVGTREITASVTWKSESFSGSTYDWSIDVDQAIWLAE